MDELAQRGCCQGCKFGLGFLAVSLAVLTSLTVIITYVIAVHHDHVYPYLPTISDTGAFKPESSIFGFFLEICAFIAFMLLLLRFFQVNNMLDSFDGEQRVLRLLNRISLVVGISATVGLAVIAAYQGLGSSMRGHFIGAILLFVGGLVYCFLQTFITYGTVDHGYSTSRLFVYRLVISVCDVFLLIFGQITGAMASSAWNTAPPIHNQFRWHPGDPGYVLNLLSNVSEWLMAVCLLGFFLTFTGELNRVRLDFNIRHRVTYTRPFYRDSESSNAYATPTVSSLYDV